MSNNDDAIRKAIEDGQFKLTTPSIHFHRLVVDADQELKRLTQVD